MANDKQIIEVEKQLNLLSPQFADVLKNTGVPVERLIRTVVVSVERTPKLLECSRQSIMNAAMSAAVLGLEVDGASNQAYLIPFKSKAQLVIGYKGMSTLAARSGYTINGGVVRDGDEFDFEEGTAGFVRHKRKLGNESKRQIIAAWATATAAGRPPIVAVVSIDELMATKAKSPGAKKSDSPWNDKEIGWPAMCEKTAKRRLARSMPLNVMQYAAAMEDQLELGRAAHIEPERGVVIDGEATREEGGELLPEDLQEPEFVIMNANGTVYSRYQTVQSWQSSMNELMGKLTGDEKRMTAMLDANRDVIKKIANRYQEGRRIIDLLGKEGLEV